ncbi:flagellar hook-associated protein FlgK [Aureimonas mangrovi]|uniref:flagellar hook-associated protein FlgK n=1 Tax=Aureimonas mangrovi TaxID=2758041 RepID=UPI00163DB37C|nr:flagellar hook-associated protein FlgK [Aureimonas mangrovi]
MSLSSALDTAKSSLIASQTHTALVSRNIANLNDPSATRKYANVVTGIGGRVEIASIARSQNAVLYRNMLDSTASVGAWSSMSAGYQRIDEVIGDTTLGRSPAARISDLADALAAFSANPGNPEFARAALDASRELAGGLNELATTVETVRRDADASLVAAAEDMNKLLAEIETLNDRVVSGTLAGTDVTDFVDRRDQAVTKLSEYVGVNARIRGNNDLVLYTDSGVNLFDRTARQVEFTPTTPLVAGQPGASFRIDGVVVTGEGSPMPVRSGSVLGLTMLRDEVALTFGNQLDAIAGALVDAFAEQDAAGGFVNGLFTLKPGFTRDSAGLAGAIVVHQNAIDDPMLIRSGGISDEAVRPTPAQNAPGYNARIEELVAKLGESRDFTGKIGIEEKGTLASFAASSLGWLQAGRSAAMTETEYRTTLLERTQETLSNETGVNLATEMTLLTDLQRSYQASARLISAVDEMLQTLLQSV